MNTHDSTSPDDELITRWIDGELSDEERAAFEHRLESDTTFATAAENASSAGRQLGDLLRAEIPNNVEPPSPELFNARIMNNLAPGDVPADADADDDTVVRPASSVWNKMPWLISAAAVIVAGFIVIQKPPTDRTSSPRMVTASKVSNTYAPREGIKIRTRFSPEAGATVLSLEGLEEIPSSYEIEGELVASYLPVAPGDAPVFASAESGEPVFVLLRNAYNVPAVVRLSHH